MAALHDQRDYDSDAESVEGASEDAAQYDKETLMAEEEAERLLSDPRRSRHSNAQEERKSKRRRGRKSWRSSSGPADSEIIKVEEGGRSSDDSASSSDVDVGATRLAKSSSKLATCGKIAALHFVILLAFFAFAYGAYRASGATPLSIKSSYVPRTLSNGTHDFAPTTILISLDGFRADFLHRGLTPTLKSFVQQGVSPKYMMPSFPSLTFPNHFTLVTGKYPSEHGIVGNNFWDPVMRKQFTYTNSSLSNVPEYWNAEPLWETAELQGVPAAIHMWPGSEAHIGSVEPAYVDKYNGAEKLSNKVDRILGWLDLPGPAETGSSGKTPRPQLIAAYVPNVDSDGHKYGPNSTYIRSTITEVDGMLGSFFKGISARNLTDIVNIIIVSDHGMATTSTQRMIQLDDLIDLSEIEHIDGWPLYGLRPYNQTPAKLQELYTSLKEKEALHPRNAFQVYLRDHDMPERYHFSHNPRIAPLWLVPAVGWAIAPKHEFDISAALANNEDFAPKGLHGYDNDHPLMRAIFVARGPAFPHAPGSLLAPFYNIEVYGIVCQSLGLEMRPHNGSLTLPLVTVGVHDVQGGKEWEEEWEVEAKPVPHVDAGILLPPSVGPQDIPSVEQSDEAETETEPDQGKDEGASEEGQQTTEAPADEGGEPHRGDESTSWRQWIDGKFDQFRHWVTGVFGEHKKVGGQTPGGEELNDGTGWD